MNEDIFTYYIGFMIAGILISAFGGFVYYIKAKRKKF